ncbi:MAG: MFS transporter [Rhodobacteraceae bacterium]|nr:MFS transporter [Paracoccaceae bacterium]
MPERTTTFLRNNAPFLLAGVILTFCSSFGQTFFISVFAGAIQDEFGLSHGAWGTIYSVGTMASAAAMIWAGVLTDVMRVRLLGPIVLGSLACACLLMASVSSIFMLTLAVFALRLAGQGMSVHIGVVAVSRWFNANRGKAISVVVLGVAAGEALLPLIFASLLPHFDWRVLWVLAALIVLVLVPILWPLLRLERTPQAIAQDQQTTGMDQNQWTRRNMLRHPLFWFILPALLAPAAFSTAFFFQQVHLAEVKGWGHITLVALFPVFTASAITSMLVFGWLIDRIGTARIMPFFQIPMALGFLLFSFADSIAVAALAMALMGMSQGANSTVPNAFWAEFYGTLHLGSVKSLATACMVLGTAIGPAITGLGIDAGIPFPQQMPFISLYFLCAAALVYFGVTRYRSLLR